MELLCEALELSHLFKVQAILSVYCKVLDMVGAEYRKSALLALPDCLQMISLLRDFFKHLVKLLIDKIALLLMVFLWLPVLNFDLFDPNGSMISDHAFQVLSCRLEIYLGLA